MSDLQEEGEERRGRQEKRKLLHSSLTELNPPQQVCGYKNVITYSEMLWRKTRTCSLIPSETPGLSEICRKKPKKHPKISWKHSKCFAENKPTQGLRQPEPL